MLVAKGLQGQVQADVCVCVCVCQQHRWQTEGTTIQPINTCDIVLWDFVTLIKALIIVLFINFRSTGAVKVRLQLSGSPQRTEDWGSVNREKQHKVVETSLLIDHSYSLCEASCVAWIHSCLSRHLSHLSKCPIVGGYSPQLMKHGEGGEIKGQRASKLSNEKGVKGPVKHAATPCSYTEYYLFWTGYQLPCGVLKQDPCGLKVMRGVKPARLLPEMWLSDNEPKYFLAEWKASGLPARCLLIFILATSHSAANRSSKSWRARTDGANRTTSSAKSRDPNLKSPNRTPSTPWLQDKNHIAPPGSEVQLSGGPFSPDLARETEECDLPTVGTQPPIALLKKLDHHPGLPIQWHRPRYPRDATLT